MNILISAVEKCVLFEVRAEFLNDDLRFERAYGIMTIIHLYLKEVFRIKLYTQHTNIYFYKIMLNSAHLNFTKYETSVKNNSATSNWMTETK